MSGPNFGTLAGTAELEHASENEVQLNIVSSGIVAGVVTPSDATPTMTRSVIINLKAAVPTVAISGPSVSGPFGATFTFGVDELNLEFQVN